MNTREIDLLKRAKELVGNPRNNTVDEMNWLRDCESLLSSLPTQVTVKSAEEDGQDDVIAEIRAEQMFQNNEAVAPQFDNPIAEARHRAGKRIEEAKKIKVVATQSQGAVGVIQKRIEALDIDKRRWQNEMKNTIQTEYKIHCKKVVAELQGEINGLRLAYQSLLTTLPPQSEVDNGPTGEDFAMMTIQDILEMNKDKGAMGDPDLLPGWAVQKMQLFLDEDYVREVKSSPGKATQSGEAMRPS